MLRSFRLTNHRSFAVEQELSLLPVYDRDRVALPVAAIYGANASGKSNLLSGLCFMRYAVLNSFQRWEPESGVPRRPFRLNPDLRSEPSGYVVEAEIGDVRYTYGFTVDDERVLEEWLYSYPEKKKRVLFERSGDEVKFGSTLGSTRAKLELIHELTRPNALFLSVALQSDVDVVMPVYHWFRRAITLRNSDHSVSELAAAVRVRRYVRDDPRRYRMLVELLTIADVGISDMLIIEEKVLSDRAAHAVDLRKREPKLYFGHSGSAELFGFEDESAGTRSWLSLLPYALDALENGGVMVIDEIDASLHPLLTARLIGLFREEQTNPHSAQLIFTTHDASLLGTALGEEVLARDQIWFVEKDRNGASRLYPLSDFKPREGENRERRYLGGSYGAVPVVSPTGFADAVREG